MEQFFDRDGEQMFENKHGWNFKCSMDGYFLNE